MLHPECNIDTLLVPQLRDSALCTLGMQLVDVKNEILDEVEINYSKRVEGESELLKSNEQLESPIYSLEKFIYSSYHFLKSPVFNRILDQRNNLKVI
jgi:hypothetical protein